MQRAADWILLDLRRHYCTVCITGGGMLFPSEGDSAYGYTTACLDKCAEYGVRFVPSTYVTQHHDTAASRESCVAAMRRAAGLWRQHPGLLAYWLVDEPQPSTAPDFYWGKQAFEELDPNHPSLCTCNGIAAVREFAPTLPFVCIDDYPIAPTPVGDAGAWAVGDLVGYARRLGARRIWLLPQAFGQSSWRAPSLEEFGIQIWSALAEGAPGFAPYAYGGRATWHSPAAEWGNLVDAHGNASPAWEEMRRLGPFLRSAGSLLVGATRLPEDAAAAQVREFEVSGTGRKRPAIVARMFEDRRRQARYLVVYNNTRFYRTSCQVAIRDLVVGQRVLDLLTQREATLAGKAFAVVLPPCAGRIYALAKPAALERVRREVLQRRIEIERDLLALEMRLARRMGTNTAPAEQADGEAMALAWAARLPEALEKTLGAVGLLEAEARANRAFWSVHPSVQQPRATLGRVGRILGERAFGSGAEALKGDPRAAQLDAQVIAVSDRFYDIQSQILRQGPAGLAGPAEALLRDACALEAAAKVVFGE